MLTKAEAIHLILDYKLKLKELGIPVRQLFLFGSIAKGSQRLGSDIDVAVIYNAFAKDPYTEKQQIRNARWSIDARLEVVCFRPDQLLNKYSTLAQEVQKYGIEV